MSVEGEFVAVFPVLGTMSEAHARRAAYDQLISLTKAAQVRVLEHWTFQLQSTPQGRVLTCRATAVADRPAALVLDDAAEFARELAGTHPMLARGVRQRLAEIDEEAA